MNAGTTPGSMQKKTGLLVALLAGLIVLLVIAGILRGLLVRHERRGDHFSDAILPMENCWTVLFASAGSPKETLSPLDIDTYLLNWERLEPILSELASTLGTGSRRKANERLRLMKESAVAAASALRDLESERREVQVRLDAAEKGISRARGILKATSDSNDFEAQIKELGVQSAILAEQAAVMAKPGAEGIAQGNEGFHKALSSGFVFQITGEKERVEEARRILNEALKDLATVQKKMAGVLQGNTTLLRGIEMISSRLGPAVNLAYSATTPLRDFLLRADAPIGGNVGGALGNLQGFFGGGGGSAGPVSALSLARQVDPNIAMTIDVMKGVCTGIETVRREIGAIQEVTSPLMRALSRFEADPDGPAMMEMAAAAGRAAGYYRQKTGIFDPVLSKIGEARPHIQRLYTLGDRLPLARGFFNGCGQAASHLVNLAQEPFLEGKRTIVNLSEGLRSVASFQQEYEGRLERLASGISMNVDSARLRIERMMASLPSTLLERANSHWRSLRFFRARTRYRRIIASFPDHPAAREAKRKIKTAGWISAGVWGGIILLVGIIGLVGLVSTGSIHSHSRQIDIGNEKRKFSALGCSPAWKDPMPGKVIVRDETETRTGDGFPPGTAPGEAPSIPVCASAAQPATARIEFVRGEFTGNSFPLPTDRAVVIGRDPKEANIVLTDPRISRKHLNIHFDPQNGRVVFKDLRSSHGVIINGRKMFAGEELAMAPDCAPLVVLADTAAAFILRLG